MFYINVKGGFSGAHRIRGYNGSCEKLHGHNWKVEVYFTNASLDKRGILFDFKEAKEALKEVLKYFDHKYLNNLKEFKKLNPSAENIAFVLANKMQEKIGRRAEIDRVVVWETDITSAIYVVKR